MPLYTFILPVNMTSLPTPLSLLLLSSISVVLTTGVYSRSHRRNIVLVEQLEGTEGHGGTWWIME